MSLEAILAAISSQGEAEIAAIEAEARQVVTTLQNETALNAAHLRETARQQVLDTIPAERDHRLQRAKQEAVRIVGLGREQIVSQVLNQARQALAETRRLPDHPELLRQLVEEAIAAVNQDIESDRLIVAADPRDQALVDPLIDSLMPRYDLDTWGGVMVMTKDERITVDNTLETRFERGQAELRRRIAALFTVPDKPGKK